MADLKIRTRDTGATARMEAGAMPVLSTPTGGQLDLVTGVSAPGFNPLDLLYASLAACLALSIRSAATKLGVTDRLGEVSAEVRGEKAAEGPSRVARIEAVLHIGGDLDNAMRDRLIHMAEGICTVSNTLAGGPEIAVRRG